MKQYSAHDGQQELRFVGDVLGTATSYSPNRPRWIEITIFKTEAGNYVLQGVGQTSVPGETKREWTHVSEEPQGIIETLTMQDADGVMYLTNVAKEALRQASSVDQKMRDAYMVRTIE